MSQPVFQISVLNTNRDFFDYCIANTPAPHIGARVWVPFRNKKRLGIVLSNDAPQNHELILKPISEVIDPDSFLTEELLGLCRWISRYYHAPLPFVFALALPKRFRLGQGLSTRTRKKIALPIVFSSDRHDTPNILNDEQSHVIQTITQQAQTYGCYLLHGVTGSGKTEVYLQLAAHILNLGQQVLILAPEIGLTPQLLSRFNTRLQMPIAVIHSHISDNERARIWQEAKENKIQVIIGTRSALFTPMPHLGLIVIDEEHDASFKQMDGVRFSARDAGIMRAQLNNIPIILGSATPSLESLFNCERGKYTQLHLRQKAQNCTPLYYQLVDLRNKKLNEGLAEETLALIKEHVDKNQQVLIFINRRGFSPVLLCHQCAWMADCHACDSHLTLHQQRELMICHHCGKTKPIPCQCPTCHSQELLPVGYGTQRIHQALSQQFPSACLVRIDRDEIKHIDTLNEHLISISEGQAQIIIGTQMLAKGHHFPNLSLVIILDTDSGFYNQDFRALERVGQLITQVAGRAGRANVPGHVVIQTHLPHHPLLNQLVQKGYASFINALLPLRKEASWPPYSHIVLLRAHAKTNRALLTFMHQIKQYLSTTALTILGPAPSPLARKASQFHMQLLIKSHSRKILHTELCNLYEHLNVKQKDHTIRWSIDVDPIDLS